MPKSPSCRVSRAPHGAVDPQRAGAISRTLDLDDAGDVFHLHRGEAVDLGAVAQLTVDVAAPSQGRAVGQVGHTVVVAPAVDDGSEGPNGDPNVAIRVRARRPGARLAVVVAADTANLAIQAHSAAVTEAQVEVGQQAESGPLCWYQYIVEGGRRDLAIAVGAPAPGQTIRPQGAGALRAGGDRFDGGEALDGHRHLGGHKVACSKLAAVVGPPAAHQTALQQRAAVVVTERERRYAVEPQHRHRFGGVLSLAVSQLPIATIAPADHLL